MNAKSLSPADAALAFAVFALPWQSLVFFSSPFLHILLVGLQPASLCGILICTALLWASYLLLLKQAGQCQAGTPGQAPKRIIRADGGGEKNRNEGKKEEQKGTHMHRQAHH